MLIICSGPQWIHTSGHNPLLRLAEETKTPLHSWNRRSHVYDEDGQLVESSKADELSDLVWEIVDEALKFSEEHPDQIPETMNLFNFFQKRAQEIFPDEPRDQKLLLNMSQMWGAYIGHPIEKQSLKFAWMERCCVGGILKSSLYLKFDAYVGMRLIRRTIDEVIVTTTYEAILQKVAEVALASAEIEFNKKVVSIEGPENGRDANQPVILRTEDGSTQSFDEVVLTTPLGWLKRNKAAFSPGLPPRLSEAIDNVSVGYLEKVRKTTIPPTHQEKVAEQVFYRRYSPETRFSSHSATHSGSTLPPPRPTTHSQATPISSRHTTAPISTPPTGAKKHITSPPTRPQTNTPPSYSTYTETAPATSSNFPPPPLTSTPPAPAKPTPSTPSSHPTSPSSPTSPPPTQPASPPESSTQAGDSTS